MLVVNGTDVMLKQARFLLTRFQPFCGVWMIFYKTIWRPISLMGTLFIFALGCTRRVKEARLIIQRQLHCFIEPLVWGMQLQCITALGCTRTVKEARLITQLPLNCITTLSYWVRKKY